MSKISELESFILEALKDRKWHDLSTIDYGSIGNSVLAIEAAARLYELELILLDGTRARLNT